MTRAASSCATGPVASGASAGGTTRACRGRAFGSTARVTVCSATFPAASRPLRRIAASPEPASTGTARKEKNRPPAAVASGNPGRLAPPQEAFRSAGSFAPQRTSRGRPARSAPPPSSVNTGAVLSEVRVTSCTARLRRSERSAASRRRTWRPSGRAAVSIARSTAGAAPPRGGPAGSARGAPSTVPATRAARPAGLTSTRTPTVPRTGPSGGAAAMAGGVACVSHQTGSPSEARHRKAPPAAAAVARTSSKSRSRGGAGGSARAGAAGPGTAGGAGGGVAGDAVDATQRPQRHPGGRIAGAGSGRRRFGEPAVR